MNLTEKPELVNWPSHHYVFIEKKGPFDQTAQGAWMELHEHMEFIKKQVKTLGFLSLYRLEPEMIYRAGVRVDQKPEKLPPGYQWVQFKGGKYHKFVLTGSYENLPEACGRVFEIADELNFEFRDDFFIESYLNDPKTTLEDELVTEILLPII